MKVTQIFELTNQAVNETLGVTELLEEDLGNLVDVGNEIFNTDNVDNYVKKLVNQVGKMVFVNRKYTGNAPSVLMDSWEFGSILQKISAELPEATESDSWNLIGGKDYSPDIFYQPEVSAKFFNSKVTFEIPLSFTELQVKESFQNAGQLNAFLSMLTTSVENAMTIKTDSLIMSTINNMIGETLFKDSLTESGNLSKTAVSPRAINLLKLYNDEYGTTLTEGKALSDPDFIRYAIYIIKTYQDRLTRISTLFNAGGKDRFTPKSDLNLVLLSDLARSSEVFLQSEARHVNNLDIGNYDTVPYWQGSGTKYSYDDITRINIKTSEGNVVDVHGILGVMFDKQALGVTNLDRRVTTNYNPKAEFYTTFYKYDAGYFNDFNENFIVFYVA